MTKSPKDGGCWFCWEDYGEMLFSYEFDSWLHEKCCMRCLADGDEEAEIIAREFGWKLEDTE